MNSRMNALAKLATITMLIAECGDTDEVQFELDGIITNLTNLRDVLGYEDRTLIAYTKDELEGQLGEAYREGLRTGKEMKLFTCNVCVGSFDLDDCVCVEIENGKPKTWKCCECIANEELKKYEEK